MAATVWEIGFDLTTGTTSSTTTTTYSTTTSSTTFSTLSSTTTSTQPPGSVCYGHSTGVEEDYTRTISGNGSGTATVIGSGDNEKLVFYTGDYWEFDSWNFGSGNCRILKDKYLTGYDGSISVKYKDGATQALCEADSWHDYSGQFTCSGWVKVRLDTV